MLKIEVNESRVKNQSKGTTADVFCESVVAVVSIIETLENNMPFFDIDAFFKTVKAQKELILKYRTPCKDKSCKKQSRRDKPCSVTLDELIGKIISDIVDKEV